MGNNFGDWFSANGHAIGNAFSHWWNYHIMTIYHAHASWINFCIILLVVAEILNFAIAYAFKQYIIRNSPIYREIMRINDSYPFYNLPKVFFFTEQRNRSDSFANIDIETYAKKEFRNRATLLTERFSLAVMNRLQLESYRKSIFNISQPSMSSTKGPLFRFLFEGLEKEIYRDAMVYPVFNPLYVLVVKYNTKEKRMSKDSYCDHVYMERLFKIARNIPLNQNVMDLEELMWKDSLGDNYSLYYQKHKKNYANAATAQQAHSTAIQPGMRYQVIDRDNYRCVRCGRSANDGVQLDAYFITPPPSGEVEFRNLRTLCNDCARDATPVKKVRVKKVSTAPKWFVDQERAKMTPALKESIKRRDGYRCKYCGRTMADGVSLEVDHIIPVSRGGRSEPSNLQTLCWDCNRGKSNSIPSNMSRQGGPV